MTQENKDRLLRLLQQYKELGISEQIDFDKFYLEGGRGKTEEETRLPEQFPEFLVAEFTNPAFASGDGHICEVTLVLNHLVDTFLEGVLGDGSSHSVFLCHLLIERLLPCIGSGLNACKLLKHLLYLTSDAKAL